MAINQPLLTARKRRHWSQTKAAQTCGVDLQTFFRWEHGEQSPHGYNLERLCEVFGASAEQLGYAPEGIEAEERDSSVDYSKRNALKTLATVARTTMMAPFLMNLEPWEQLITTKTAAMNAETINHFRELLRISWELSNSNELLVVEGMLPQFLPRLLHAANSQPEAALLAAQGLRLQGILAAHKLQLGEKVTQSKQAVAYARFSTDDDALVSSLTELAVAYKYANQPHLALQTYQEALASLHQASPLLQSRVYAASASAFAKVGRKREARFYIDLAHETFPSQPEHDPSVTFADYGIWLLIFYTGLTHLDLGEYQEAWDAFDQIRRVSVTVPERNRLEIINQQGRAAILRDNLDEYALSLGNGIAGSVALRSKKRFDEALHIFRQEMSQSWLANQSIKEIVEQYHLAVERPK